MSDELSIDLDQFYFGSLDPMAVAGTDGFFKALNPAWTTLLGWDVGDLLSDPFMSFVHRDDIERTTSELAHLAGGGTTVSFENRYRCRDGTYRWLQWNAEPRGDVIYAIARDVTRGKDTEAALRASEQFLASVVENIPNMVFVKDAAELRFVRMNRAGEELLGYSRDDLLGKNDFDFFPEAEAVFFVEKDRHVLATGELVDIPVESIDTRVHGTRLLHTKKIPLVDDSGKPTYLLGIAEDITESANAARMLHEREQTLDAVFQTSPDAILVLSADLRIRDVNSAEETTSGVPPDVRRGQSPLANVHPDDQAAVERALRELVGGDDTTWCISYRVRGGSGGWTSVEARGRTLRDKDGAVSGAVIYQRDMTDAIAARDAEHRALRSETEHRLVLDLQRRALIAAPTMDGLEVVAHYQPAERELGIGGDWYQGLSLAGGRLGVVVGDVVGHGTAAAADMTQLSGAVATLLRAGSPLERVLDVADDLASSLDITATLVMCVIDPATNAMEYASAGHPPPILVGPDGSIEILNGSRRRLLGLNGAEPARRPATIGRSVVPVGSTLVAYTDGLIERRTEDFDRGLDRLIDALRATAGLDIAEQLREVVRRCTADHQIEDDIAVMAVRATAGAALAAV